jgi:hypothetical protein
VHKICLIPFCVLMVGTASAQSTAARPLRFDLAKIGMVVNGQQECNDTNNRLQDLPSREMDRITAGGLRSVPILIAMIADSRMAKTREPIFCYWPGMAIGDIAFCLLDGLFRDTKGATTVPGSGWHDMLGSDNDLPAWEQIRKSGRASLKAKWQKVWARYKDQVYGDAQDRCFRLGSR